MTDLRIAGEPIELIEAAFRGMQARREADGWVSISGRLDPVPGEALMRALKTTEMELPRRIGSTRDEHRAAALDEIVRQVELLVGRAPGESDTPTETPIRERFVRADEAIDDAFAGGRARGRVDREPQPVILRVVTDPDTN